MKNKIKIFKKRSGEASVKTTDIKDIAKLIAARMVFGLFLISAVIIFIVSELVNLQMINYETTVTEATQNHLRASVQALSNLVSAEELDLFHTVEDKERPEYQEMREQLKNFAREYNVLYAYYWRYYGDSKLQYIIDNDTDPETQVGPEDIELIEEIAAFSALLGDVDVTDLGDYTPTWEGLLTAYAPVFDSDGNVYCVAGVDISDEFIFIQRSDAHNMKLLQMISIPLAVILAVINMMLYRKKTKQIEEAHIKLQYFNNNLRRAFSTYLSEDVVEEIVSDPTRLQLGGIKRHMTVLFTDVKNFSRIAEALAPEQLVDLLNYYLSSLSDVILNQKGTIDKYQGDAIVSFFGAPLELPDHALRACVSAVIMKRMEAEINNYVEENNLSPTPLLTRIGINSGDMVVGNMGTQKKMNYTIIANAVNLAARLEGLNKQYGTWVMASEATIMETKGLLLTRRLDRVRVVGINEPVRVHEVLEIKADASDTLREQVNRFHNALDLFEARSWKDAEAAFNHVLGITPNDKVSLLYIDRCRQYQKAPPLNDWDGVFNFSEK